MRFKLTHYWYHSRRHPFILLLLPFSWLFGVLCAGRRFLYRTGLKKKYQVAVPVVIVGNITVGGTGKTPFVIWLANWLRSQGYHPGIVSRGVGGTKKRHPHYVQDHDQPKEVGDEALLLKNHTACPLVIGIDRVAAVSLLLQQSSCDVIISDDGLQHYRLDRDIEIALIDATREFGNQHLLPAGPLRESIKRLNYVDFVIKNGGDQAEDNSISLIPTQLVSLNNQQQIMSLMEFVEKNANKTIHALAGIGHPERFFAVLRQAGLQVIPHVFPDHYLFKPEDICFTDSYPIIMTEKDAIKCTSFATAHCWYLATKTQVNARLADALLARLKNVATKRKDEFKKECGLYIS